MSAVHVMHIEIMIHHDLQRVRVRFEAPSDECRTEMDLELESAERLAIALAGAVRELRGGVKS